MGWFDESMVYLKGLIVPLMNDFIVAVLTLFVGLIIGRIAGRLVNRILHEWGVNKFVSQVTGFKTSFEEIGGMLASYFVYSVALIIALNQIGITTWVVYAVAGVAVVILLISVGLAVKDVLPNVIAGCTIRWRGFPQEGDQVTLSQISGVVTAIHLLESRLKTGKGDEIVVPNVHFIREVVSRKSPKKSQKLRTLN